MNFKKTNAETTTITRDTNEMAEKAGNLYEATAIMSKRANQIGVLLKEELIAKINEFATDTDNLEEIFENREQIEISKFYESLPKPAAISIKEYMSDNIYSRKVDTTEMEEDKESESKD